jgi:prepilin-type N-terminal cleavage/methylation domain-containing protein
MRPHPDQTRRRARGFTLLEIILAMFVLVLLVTGIFAIVGGTTQLADEMERAHERDARAHSFAQFCERTLRNLPANAQVRMRLTQSGNQYIGELALKNAPSPIGSTGANGMTILRTEQATDGYLRVVLEMLTNEEARAKELGKGDAVKQKLVLLENVAKCEWKFFNPLSGEWESVWNDKLSLAPLQASEPATPPGPGQALAQPQVPPSLGNARRPSLVELTFAIGADAPRRFVFWVPPASPPGGLAAGSNPAGAPAQDGPPQSGLPGGGTLTPPPAVLPVRR